MNDSFRPKCGIIVMINPVTLPSFILEQSTVVVIAYAHLYIDFGPSEGEEGGRMKTTHR
jgi:hypothetical protein